MVLYEFDASQPPLPMDGDLILEEFFNSDPHETIEDLFPKEVTDTNTSVETDNGNQWDSLPTFQVTEN